MEWPNRARDTHKFNCWMRYLAVRCSRAANTASVACHGAMRVQAHPNRAVGAACVHAAAAVLTKTLILTPLLKAYYFSVFHGVDGCHTVPAPSCMHRCRPTPPIPRAGAVLGPGQHACPYRDSITTWKWESMEWPNRARDTHKFNCWMRYLAVRCSRAANTASVACHGAMRVQAHPNRAVGAACVHAAAAVLTKTLILTPLLKAYYFSVFHGVDGCHTVPAPSCMHRCRPTPPIPRAGAVLGPGQHACPYRDSITTWKWESMEWPNRARDTHKFNCWMRYLAVRCSRAANTASVACHGAMRVQAHPNRAVGAACVHAAAAVLTKTLILTPLLKAYYFSVFHGVDGCHTVPAPSCMHRCRPTPPIPRAGAVLGPGQHACPYRDSITTWKWESMEWPNRARDTHKFNCWMRYLAVRCSRAANTASVACHGAMRVQAHPNRAVGAACVHAAAAVLTKTLILTPLLKAYYFSVFHGVDGCHTVPAPSCMHRCRPLACSHAPLAIWAQPRSEEKPRCWYGQAWVPRLTLTAAAWPSLPHGGRILPHNSTRACCTSTASAGAIVWCSAGNLGATTFGREATLLVWSSLGPKADLNSSSVAFSSARRPHTTTQ